MFAVAVTPCGWRLPGEHPSCPSSRSTERAERVAVVAVPRSCQGSRSAFSQAIDAIFPARGVGEESFFSAAQHALQGLTNKDPSSPLPC